MNRLERALVDAARYLDEAGIPYMVFGGIANLQWGRSRLTEDVDIKLILEESRWAEFLERLGRTYRLLPGDALTFARATRVIPIETPDGIRVDLVLADLPYEEEAVRRAVALPIGGAKVRVCTAEDLILHKIISDRTRDRDDVEGVVVRRAATLDREYLDPRLRALAEGLERPDILEYFGTCLRKAGAAPAAPGAADG